MSAPWGGLIEGEGDETCPAADTVLHKAILFRRLEVISPPWLR